MNEICELNEIKIIKNSLIVFDFDETIIKFKLKNVDENINIDINTHWWCETFDKYYYLYNNNELANKYTLNDWIKIISTNDPILVDEKINLFIEQLKNNNCEIIVITTRNIEFSKITYEQIKKLNIDIKLENIYFNNEKGTELNKLLNTKYNHIKNVIIIDSMNIHLHDMYDKISSFVQVHLYKIL